MKKTEIIDKINEYIPVKGKQVVEKSIDANRLTYVELRDRLTGREHLGACL